ncbi:fimbria/pilus outer membrane usher protein [Pantoea sp. NSTU24]|uniref:fimbria/pilus outer membrane usher protein n=1 Tax=Pantoea sp. NSTU24 TaxID=3391144 RepID=UPI003D092CB8
MNKFSCLAFLLLFNTTLSFAEVSFNTSFLELNGSPGDMDALKKQVENISRTQPAGEYWVEIYINENLYAKQSVNFSYDKKRDKITPCLDSEFFKNAGLKENAWSRLQHSGNCAAFTEALDGADFVYDFARQKLLITIPQAFLNDADRTRVKAGWDNGETVLFSSYSLSHSQIWSAEGAADKHKKTSFISLNNGFNYGAWRFRNVTYIQDDGENRRQLTSPQSYVQRPLPQLDANLSLGDVYSNGEILEGINYRGVQLASDISMLPAETQGFAPTLRGTANGRSKVSVSQNGFKIFERWVPSGPFNIDNIPSVSGGDDLLVTIENEAGEKQFYRQPASALPVMVRGGQFFYEFNAGQYRTLYPGTSAPEPYFVAGTARYGLSGNTTLFGGVLLNSNYQAYDLGFSRNLAGYGALSADSTLSVFKPVGAKDTTQRGNALRLRYAKDFSGTGTNLTLAGYRYNTRGFRRFSEAFEDYRVASQSSDAILSNSGLKNSVSATVSQRLTDNSSVYLNYNKDDFWQSQPARQTLQTGYSFNVGRASITLSGTFSHLQEKQTSAFALSFSMPLSATNHSPRLYTTSGYSAHNLNNNVTISDTSDSLPGLSYSANAASIQGEGEKTQAYGVSAQYSGAKGDLRTSLSHSDLRNQLDIGGEGGLTLYKGSLIASPPLGDTNIIARTNKIENVGFDFQSKSRTNKSGYAMLTNASPYTLNRVSVRTNTLDDNVEIEKLVGEVTPTRGAFSVIDFSGKKGNRIILHAVNNKGEIAPFAAEVFINSEKEQMTPDALVSENGSAYITGVPDNARFEIKVNSERWCAGEISSRNDHAAKSGVIKVNTVCR